MGKLEEFTWKQIFDSDACTRCGRCQDGCPAYLSGKPLSPKKVIQDLKTYWLEQAPAAIAAKRRRKRAGTRQSGKEASLDARPSRRGRTLTETGAGAAEKAMVGEVIDLHELWACTNCMYCMEHCSSSIEHVPKIVGMRQYKVLTEADFAPELQLTYRNMENNSNPWGIGSHLRADWAKDLGIKTLAEDPNVEYLFYVGCSGSFDDRGKEGLRGLRQDPPDGGRQFRHPRNGRGVLRRFGHAGRKRIPLSDPGPGEHRDHERLRRQEDHLPPVPTATTP